MKRYAKSGLCVVIGLIALGSTLCWADENVTLRQLQQDNAQLRDRLDKLENELAQIRAQLGERVAPVMDKKPVRASLEMELYGYVKLDAAYDDSRTSSGNYARWVESEQIDQDDQFSMTANQTRLGLRIKGPESENLQTSGLLEVDFYGGGSENKPNPMLRHAYLNAYWPDWQAGLLAGQTSDVISPLVMPTINYTAGWWQGNIGYRRPQVRLTKELRLADQVTAKLELAATRAITGRQTVFGRVGGDTGEDADFPHFQGRASLSFPLLADRPTAVGVSGHWGQEERDTAADGRHQRYDTWSVNADLTMPLTTWLTFQGEAFLGENLDAYLGGVGQGFNTNRMDVVAATGAWAAFTVNPAREWKFSVGAGFDNPQDGDLTAGLKDLDREFNAVVFGNAWYNFNPHFSIGLEISGLRTDYQGRAHGDCLREQISLLYKF
ncbi:hypothetical protein HQ590_01885 [bacterium]|nr:hypothetical protein [bacterium]